MVLQDGTVDHPKKALPVNVHFVCPGAMSVVHRLAALAGPQAVGGDRQMRLGEFRAQRLGDRREHVGQFDGISTSRLPS